MFADDRARLSEEEKCFREEATADVVPMERQSRVAAAGMIFQ
jgi:hypothetical protein